MAHFAQSPSFILHQVTCQFATGDTLFGPLNVALEEALKDCLRAIELEASAPIYDSLGFVYLRLGRYEDSVKAYDSALGMRANQADSLFGRALAKRGLGDQAGYEQDMRDAVRSQPEIEEQFARYGVTP